MREPGLDLWICILSAMATIAICLWTAGCSGAAVQPRPPRPRLLDTYACHGGAGVVRLTIRGELVAVEVQADNRAIPTSCVLQPLAEPVR